MHLKALILTVDKWYTSVNPLGVRDIDMMLPVCHCLTSLSNQWTVFEGINNAYLSFSCRVHFWWGRQLESKIVLPSLVLNCKDGIILEYPTDATLTFFIMAFWWGIVPSTPCHMLKCPYHQSTVEPNLKALQINSFVQNLFFFEEVKMWCFSSHNLSLAGNCNVWCHL